MTTSERLHSSSGRKTYYIHSLRLQRQENSVWPLLCGICEEIFQHFSVRTAEIYFSFCASATERFVMGIAVKNEQRLLGC